MRIANSSLSKLSHPSTAQQIDNKLKQGDERHLMDTVERSSVAMSEW
jgi:hypothetical protein